MMQPPRLTRRRIFLGGSLAALAVGLTDVVQYRRAMAAGAEPEADDGRPAMKGTAPVLFIGHGSPMNALQDNSYTRHLRAWGRQLGTPQAIAVVSAHWLTDDSLAVSVDAQNRTLHDFGGFPPALFAQRYPAPGAPDAARRAVARFAPQRVGEEQGRGLDHGVWTVLRHLYPQARVPVFQVSINITRDSAYQLAVGRALAALRAEGVLIIGSGNVVHNLGDLVRSAADSGRGLRPWADDFDQQVKAALDARDTAALRDPELLGPHGLHAVPHPDHYFPLLTALGAAQAHERAQHVFEGFQAGTISMRCVQWG
jgi:4,5-DOPA dioxygenase extradiol